MRATWRRRSHIWAGAAASAAARLPAADLPPPHACAGPAGGFDSLGAADSTVRQVSQLQRQESDFKAQLDTLKAAAMEANAAAVAAAQQSASGTGRLFPGQDGDGGLRERLEGAVAAMQAGLIERDTEVGARAGPGGWCVGGWLGWAWSNPSPVHAAWVRGSVCLNLNFCTHTGCGRLGRRVASALPCCQWYRCLLHS